MAIDMQAAVKITAGVTGQQAVDQLRTSLDRIGGTANGLTSKFNMVKGAVGAFAAALAVREVVTFGKSMIDAADRLTDLSERTGVAVEELSKLQQVAHFSDTSLESVSRGFAFLSRQMLAAASGTKSAQDSFARLNVQFKNTDGTLRNTEDVFADLADRFAEMPDGAAKVAIGQQLIGKGFVDLIPLVNRGGDAMRDVSAIVSEEFANRAAVFNDTIDEMKFATTGLINQGLNELLKSLQQVLNVYSQLNGDGSTVKIVFEGIGTAVKGLVMVIDTLVTGVRQAIATLQYFGETLFRIVTLDFEGAKDAASARLNEIVTLGQEYQKRMAELMKPPSSAVPAGSGNADRGAAPEIVDEEALKQQADAADRELDRIGKIFDDLRAKQERAREELVRQGQAAFDATRTPSEQLAIRIADLNKLLQAGVINWDTYNRSVVQAQDTFDKASKAISDATNKTFEYGASSAIKKYVEEAGNLAKQVESAFGNAFKGMEDAMVEFVMTGKLNFRDLANSIIQDIIRITIRQQISGIFGNMIGAGIGNVSTAFKYGTSIGSQQTAMLAAQTSVFANGGIMTSGGAVELKKYAKGGIANSPQLALYGEGSSPEAYVPLPDGRTIPVTMNGSAGGDTNVSVVVNVEGGGTNTQATDERGKQLGDAVAKVVREELLKQKRPGGILAAA